MKRATLKYSPVFERSPISPWIGLPLYMYGQTNDPNKDFSIPIRVEHPIDSVGGPWCRLKVHYNNINLVFSLPIELDHFIEVCSQNPLPTGYRLSKYTKNGRPRDHWLAKLPKEAKPNKFRQQLLRYLKNIKEAQSFREFYQNKNIKTHYPDLYCTYAEANIAINGSIVKR